MDGSSDGYWAEPQLEGHSVKMQIDTRPAADSNCIRIRSVRLPQFGAFWRSADFGFMKALPYVAYLGVGGVPRGVLSGVLSLSESVVEKKNINHRSPPPHYSPGGAPDQRPGRRREENGGGESAGCLRLSVCACVCRPATRKHTHTHT